MSKPQIPVTNLKDRIAALEQQRNAAGGQRSASSSPQIPSAGGSPSVGGLKDKIAKFEKKGGIPVPRGTFGLGAPPPPEARVTRNAELYGNRPGIPQPVRMLSAQHTGGSISGPSSRSGSSLGFHGNDREEWRRSVSMSSVITDLDDRPDYTPLTSPTFGYPNSPESTTTVGEFTPEGSPTVPKPVVSRSTSFAAAVEVAKKVAEGGGEGAKHEGAAPTPLVAARGEVFTAEPATVLSPIPATPIEAPTPKAADFQASPTEVLAVEKETEQQSTLPAPEAQVEVPQEPTPTSPVVSPASPVSPAVELVEPPEKKARNAKDLTLNLSSQPVANAQNGNDSSTTPTLELMDPNGITLDETTPTTATYSQANLLSPPLSATPSTLSTGSLGSSGRPFSMVELSWGERVTPATSRGNVMFIPPTSAAPARKSDLVVYPPTPTEEDTKDGVQVVDDTKEVEDENDTKKDRNDLTAVVHEKVRESTTKPAYTGKPAPAFETPRRKKHYSLMPLNSPAQPELFSLLQHAVMLESTLEHGELPEEAIARREQEQREQEARLLAAALEADKARAQAEEQKLLAFEENERAKKKEKEEADAARKSKLRHTFLIPLGKAKAVHGSSADAEAKQSRELPELPDLLPSPDKGMDPAQAASIHGVLQTNTPAAAATAPAVVTPQVRAQSQYFPPPPQVPQDTAANDRLRPKSAGVTKSRFSLRKFGSVKSIMSLGSGSKRGDVSGSDSMSVSDAASMSSVGGSALGHDEADEFGLAKTHERESTWPNIGASPTKKGPPSVSKSSTMAGKMFRGRTKSSGSTLSNMSDSSSKAASIYTLPPLPDSLSVIPPSPELEHTRDRQPRRSISMKSLKSALKGRASIDKDRSAPPVPAIRTDPPQGMSNGSTSPASTFSSLKSPDYIGFGSMEIPRDGDRPTSWMSVSSLESTLPSPLFDKGIFDAFPAVPSSAVPSQRFGSLDGGLQSAALATPSFDSAFLGSAIHLAGSTKSTMNTPNTATGAFPQGSTGGKSNRF